MGLGYLAVSAAAFFWALGGTYARRLMDMGASPIELTEARAWIATLGIGAIVIASGRSSRPSGTRARRYLPLLIAFGLALAAANLTYYLAISLLPVAVAIVIQYTAPALVVVYKAVIARQRPGSRVIGALVLTILGVALLSRLQVAGAGLDPLGLAAAAASAVSFAAYVLIGERTGRSFSTERSAFWGFVVASAFWIAFQVPRGVPETLIDPRFRWGILFLGVAGTIVPFMLFLWGLNVVTAAPAGIVSTLEPVSAALLAFFWLGQRLTISQWVGAAAVILGVAIIQLQRAQRRDDPLSTLPAPG